MSGADKEGVDRATPKADPPGDRSDAPPQASGRVAFFTTVADESEPGIVPDLVARLDESLRELFEEWAGILEFDSGIKRDHAECLALLNVYREHPLEVLGVKVFRRDSGEYLLVTDPGVIAREGLIGCEQGLVDQAITEFGGIARLVRWR